MTDRGTKLSRAQESLKRTQEALSRSIGSITEQDWRDAVVRCEGRVRELQAMDD